MRVLQTVTDDEILVLLTRKEFERISSHFLTPKDWEEDFSGKIALLNLTTRERNCLCREVKIAFLSTNQGWAFRDIHGDLMSFEKWATQRDLFHRLTGIRNIGNSGAWSIQRAIEKSGLVQK